MVSPGSAFPFMFGSGKASTFVAVMMGAAKGSGAGAGAAVAGAGVVAAAARPRAGAAASVSGATCPASIRYEIKAATKALRLRRREVEVRRLINLLRLAESRRARVRDFLWKPSGECSRVAARGDTCLV